MKHGSLALSKKKIETETCELQRIYVEKRTKFIGKCSGLNTQPLIRKNL